MRKLLLAAGVCSLMAVGAHAADRPLTTELARISGHDLSGGGTWSSWGGYVEFQLNPDRLRELGLDVSRIDRATRTIAGEPGVRYQVMRFGGRHAGALQFKVSNNKPDGLRGGALQYDGGFVVNTPKGTIDLRSLRIQPTAGGVFALDVVDAAGTVWLTMDHAHFDLNGGDHSNFRLRDTNLRLSAAFAEKLGRPELAGMDLGGADIESEVTARDTSVVEGGACSETWPATGLDTNIEVFYGTDTWTNHPDTVVSKRCNIGTSGACSASSTTGNVVISPDSSLRNVGNTAVTWHSMFSGTYPPYNNDQHPFLVWNLYRFDADGGVKQIGVSGVKHAFETVNYNCSCNDFSVIFPGCEDTYSTNNNDSSGVLGPRSELIPAKGIWGRCGSVFDANCDGNEDSGGGATNLHGNRLNAVESELLPASHPGATFYLEYWYVVRDDQNIYDTMGHRSLAVSKNNASWSVSASPVGNFTAGPAINRWVSPTAPAAGTMNSEMVGNEGRARIAVKTSTLPSGLYRYEYAVMNFDFAWAVIDPAHATEPNLKLLSNNGFEKFSLPLLPFAVVTDITFADTDVNAGNDWVGSVDNNTLSWSAPSGVNSLNWGTMYRFGFTSNIPPSASTASLSLAAAPSSYDAPTISATNDIIYIDSFDVEVSAGRR